MAPHGVHLVPLTPAAVAEPQPSLEQERPDEHDHGEPRALVPQQGQTGRAKPALALRRHDHAHQRCGTQAYRRATRGAFCVRVRVVWGGLVGVGEPGRILAGAFRVPDEWDCWLCDGTNVTPPPPWTPAD